MIQPIMITSQEPDGSIVQQTQYQIISQSSVPLDENNQVFQACTFGFTVRLIFFRKLAVSVKGKFGA